MDFYSCFVALQTSSLKVRDSSAADSPRYLLRRPLAARSERGGRKKDLPRRDNSGHFDVMPSCLKKRERPVMYLTPVSMVTTLDSALICHKKCPVLL